MTVYANLVHNEVKGVYDNIPKFWNGQNNFDILCKNDPNCMKENGFVKIIRDTRFYDSTTHSMSDFPIYTVSNGEVYEYREIYEIPPIIPPSREELLVNIRVERDKRMNLFEWRYNRYERQLRLGISTTDNIEAMDLYMQSLANITEQEDLTNIIWPSYQE
jgi:hypothetical protein